MGEALFVVALLLLLVLDADGATSSAHGVWTEVPTRDVLISGEMSSSVVGSRGQCGMQCLTRTGCASFGYRPSTRTCLLYDHLVAYITPTAAPGTRYYWLLSRRCPTELNYTLANGVCYRLYETWVHWDVARTTCSQDRATLLTATTAVKRSLAITLNGGSRYIWLGATDRATEGDWRWLTGSRVQGNWGPGQPDNWNGAHVIYLHPDTFYDDSTDATDMQPLCEFPMTPTF